MCGRMCECAWECIERVPMWRGGTVYEKIEGMYMLNKQKHTHVYTLS